MATTKLPVWDIRILLKNGCFPVEPQKSPPKNFTKARRVSLDVPFSWKSPRPQIRKSMPTNARSGFGGNLNTLLDAYNHTRHNAIYSFHVPWSWFGGCRLGRGRSRCGARDHWGRRTSGFVHLSIRVLLVVRRDCRSGACLLRNNRLLQVPGDEEEQEWESGHACVCWRTMDEMAKGFLLKVFHSTRNGYAKRGNYF